MSEEEQLKAKNTEWGVLNREIEALNKRADALQDEIKDIQQTINERTSRFKRGDIVIWRKKWRIRITEVPNARSYSQSYHGIRLKKDGTDWNVCAYLPSTDLNPEPKGNQQ